jgi:hypothetical protein
VSHEILRVGRFPRSAGVFTRRFGEFHSRVTQEGWRVSQEGWRGPRRCGAPVRIGDVSRTIREFPSLCSRNVNICWINPCFI